MGTQQGIKRLLILENPNPTAKEEGKYRLYVLWFWAQTPRDVYESYRCFFDQGRHRFDVAGKGARAELV